MYIKNSVSHIQYSSNLVRNDKSSATGQSFAELFAAQKQKEADKMTPNLSSGSVQKMDTNQGHSDMDLNNYFSEDYSSGFTDIADIPLLLPTQHNVETLSRYSQARFKELMEQYDIPSPPRTIEYDGHGEMVLPEDYPYAEQLKLALSEQPGVAKALQTTAALASHYAGMMELKPMHDELALAKTEADRDRVIAKYAHLLDDNRPATQIVLAFTPQGDLLIGGKNPTMQEQLAGHFWPQLQPNIAAK